MLLTKRESFLQQQTTVLVVIDPAVEAPQKLANGVRDGAEVLILDPRQDSIEQITNILTAGNYRSLHLVSHGSPGCLHLGNTDLNFENIAQYKQQLLEWAVSEILIYGCNVAAGTELLTQLHIFTGATIAASTKKVGNGYWNLEFQLGELTSDSVFVERLRQEYRSTFIGFLPQATFTVGTQPTSVAIGDLDGDGNPDLAVANRRGNTISVLLGDDLGGFSAPTNFTVGTTPRSVAIGDLDGDGNPDLAVANRSSNSVSVLLGDGSGDFSASTNFAAEIFPISVVIGDLNGDGNPDLAVANLGSSTVSVLLGDGSGGFSAQTTFAVGTFSLSNSVAIGDLNGDGNPDLAVANQGSNNVSVLLGDGSGSFSGPTNFAAGTFPNSVVIGDLDGDGNPDLAVTNGNSNSVSVLLGDGSGGFSAPTTLAAGTRPISVAIGDLDDDGSADDLAVTNGDSNNVSVLLGDGSGGFSGPTNFAAGTFPNSLAIGDLDGDGSADDLAVTNFTDDNVSVFIECFLTGTHILTNKGEITVEQLQIGDFVKTTSGKLEPIRWVGKQTIKPNQVKNPLRGYPVLIKAGALGNNLPHRDLYVSPDHAMFVEGLLINAGALVNNISIVKTEPTETFTYYHIELENHALLIAEGTAAESYLPQKENRDEYDNAVEYEELYPHGSNLMLWPMDYPRISSQYAVPNYVRNKLLEISCAVTA